MLSGFSKTFKNINERRKICKSGTMATQGSHHGALSNVSIFCTFVHVLFVSIFAQSYFNILKTYVNERASFFVVLYAVRFDNFLKNNLKILKF